MIFKFKYIESLYRIDILHAKISQLRKIHEIA